MKTKGKKKAMKENKPERTCLLTGEAKSADELLRFTLTPDRQVVPDFKKKLPGKGFYITNSRSVLEQAVAKNVFRKFGKHTKVAPNLGEIVENVLKNRALEAINLARKAGALIAGFEKVRENLQKGKVAFVLGATDAGSDGAAKIGAAARDTEILRLFSTDELDRALGRVNTVHAALLKGQMAESVYRQLKKWQNFNSREFDEMEKILE